MKKELNILLTAFLFYTRINVSKWVKYDKENLSLATKYLPFIGWIVGGAVGGTYWLFAQFLDPFASVALALVVSVLITGAFHEDGFADTCDGFGGGWEKDKILSIMKDSRIGTYGTLGLILLFVLKIALLIYIFKVADWKVILLISITMHSLSRFTASTFLFTHDYARDTIDSKSKEVATKPSISVLIIGAIFTAIPLCLLSVEMNNYALLLCVIPVYLAKFFLGRYFKKWIQGYTGDTLGATQQITEIIYCISFLAVWKFI